MLRNSFTFAIMVLVLWSCTEPDNRSKLLDFADRYVNIISKEKDIDGFASLYADTVLYSDPVWGTTDEILLDTLKYWFTPVFDPQTGWDFEISNVAVDEAANTFAIKGFGLDLATGERRLVTSWYKVKAGKIREQTDLTPWSLNSLKYSPRFEEALKDWPEQ